MTDGTFVMQAIIVLVTIKIMLSTHVHSIWSITF